MMIIVGVIFLPFLTFTSAAMVHAHSEQNGDKKVRKNEVGNLRKLATTVSSFIPPASSAGSSRQLEEASKTKLPTTYPTRSGGVEVPKSSAPSTVLPAPSKKTWKLEGTLLPTDVSTDGMMRKLVQATKFPTVSPAPHIDRVIFEERSPNRISVSSTATPASLKEIISPNVLDITWEHLEKVKENIIPKVWK
jgi:hypothetical protein